MEFRDLKRQYSALKREIDGAILKTVSDGCFIGGETVSILERSLADYVGVRHCITCANGTDALTIALKILGVGPGDAVFVPDFTFFATAETVAAEGATPVFVDVDPDSFNISPEDLERKIDAVRAEGRLHLKAVIPVDLFGLPADHDAIAKISGRNALEIIEDGAQGFGGLNNARRSCGFGKLSTTSFFPAKPLGCYGDGGAVFTDDDACADLARSIKVHGKGSSKYDNVRVGLNSRLDTLQAAVLQVKFEAFKSKELDAVNRVADCYAECLQGLVEVPRVPEGFVSSWAQYTIKLPDRSCREGLQAYLKGRGIPSMVYYPAGMHSQTAFAGLPQYGPCPVSDRLCGTVLSLPMHPYLTMDEIETVATEIKNFLK